MFDLHSIMVMDLERVDRGFSTYSTTGCGIKIPFHGVGLYRHMWIHCHSHDILKILPVYDRSARANMFDIFPAGNDAFGKEKPCGQLMVVPGCSHGIETLLRWGVPSAIYSSRISRGSSIANV